jgi:hypothetical protein
VTRDQKRLALAYMREVVIADLDDLYGPDATYPAFSEDRELLDAMRAAAKALRKVKADR